MIHSYLSNSISSLSKWQQCFLIILSFFIVAFGQPAWIWWLGIIAATIGYAFFFRVLLCYANNWQRFSLAASWFFAIQLVQLSWSLSHPYYYIYFVYLAISALLGLQFGILGLLINVPRILRLWQVIAIASVWTLLEWLRLFFFTGFTWNPVGLSLSGNLYSMQMASIWGIFGLSFWIIFVNLLALRACLKKFSFLPTALWMIMAATPYLFGLIHLQIHQKSFQGNDAAGSPFNVLLVQTAFPVEEEMEFDTPKNMVLYVIQEWHQILNIIKKHHPHHVDLIALPEFLVPFGTYSFVYPQEMVKQAFEELLGTESLWALPPLETPFADFNNTAGGAGWMVNNAYWAQAIANYFQSELIVGLEDAEDVNGQREFYSAALFFKPEKSEAQREKLPFIVERYEKRVLVPMGEYIPLTFLKELAAKYGVMGSFTSGKSAKVMPCAKIPFGVSICYEETFGNLMRQNRQLGAELLVNLTNDAWYPNSRLSRQHFDLARLRTVENGIPLIRACNTGITAAVDSLGRIAAVLGDEHPEEVEWIPNSLLVKVPTYTYKTLYSKVGDGLIIGMSFFVIFLSSWFVIWDRIKNR